MNYFNSLGEKIFIDSDPIGNAGAEGVVYKIINPFKYKGYCVKILHQHKRTTDRKKKVEFMINNRPTVIKDKNYKICWPEEILYENNKTFAGFIMSLAFLNSQSLYVLTTPNLNKRLPASWKKFDRSTKEGVENRYKLCVNISIAIHSIHATNNYVIIDYKPQNILLDSYGKVSILDVDSFQISNNNKLLYNAVVATPEYAPPESHKLNPSVVKIEPSWDLFSIAVSYYEVLFGIHPFAATSNGQYVNANTLSEKIQKGLFVHGSKKNWISVIPDIHNNFNNIPPSIQRLFLQTFENGHAAPKNRVTAEKWGISFHQEILLNNGIKANAIKLKNKPAILVNQSRASYQTNTRLSSVTSNYQSSNSINRSNSNNFQTTLSTQTRSPKLNANPIRPAKKTKKVNEGWQLFFILLSIVVFGFALYSFSENAFWVVVGIVVIISWLSD